MISKLYDRINHKELYKNKFDKWEARETIIDENRVIWELVNPESPKEKICLFKDGYMLLVYGYYGQYCFSNMTWDGNIHNLDYEHIEYQFSKLDINSRNALYVFTAEQAQLDAIEWMKSVLCDNTDISENDINALIEFLNNKDFDYVSNFIEEHEVFAEIEDFVTFIYELFCNVENEDKTDYINFLHGNTHVIEDYDTDISSCDLWDAGMTIHQSYYVTMYALETCSKKLKEKND